MKSRWCVFISGTGSNLRALLEARLNIVCVVSNQKNAAGLLKAKSYGIPMLTLENPVNWEQLSLQLKDIGITHIFLAGFMKIIPAQFIQEWAHRIYNIHPSLLPHYTGLKSIERAFADQGPLGATIHEVTEGVDEGPHWKQKQIQLLKDLESTELYVHIQEHQLVRDFAWTRA